MPELQCEGLGGPEMVAAGCPIHEDLVGNAIFGIGGAIRAAPHMFGVLRRVAGVLDARPPDAVVLVDNPGLNLHVARMAHRRGLPVIYFVAPQLWAWATWRARRFARVVDEAYVIFPFEVPFFEAAGIRSHYIGPPAADALPRDGGKDPAITSLPRPIALLPGSRGREVRLNMPVMLAAARRIAERFPDASFHTAHVQPEREQAVMAMAREMGVPLVAHGPRVHEVMASCHTVLIASGTATLETAMLGTPMVVFYRLRPFEWRMYRMVGVTELMAQVNLLSGRELCPEVVQTDDDPGALVNAALPLVEGGETHARTRRALGELAARLPPGGAVERAADLLVERLSASPGLLTSRCEESSAPTNGPDAPARRCPPGGR